MLRTVVGCSLIALAAAKPMNFSITSQSPTIYYSPAAVGPRFANGSTEGGTSAAGWQILYGGSDNTNWKPGDVGKSDVTVISWGVGASASFGFKGTAVYLLGSGTSANCNMTLNGATDNVQYNGPNVIAWASGLADQWWDVGLNVTGDNGCSMGGFTFTVDIGAEE